MTSSRAIRVLVFGATGVGKTSLCNTLTGRVRPTNNGPFGVTEKTHLYPFIEHQGRRIQLIDTAGLHESNGGTVPPEQAAIQIVELLENSKNGFNALVHVARASRLTKEQEEDHEFFVRKMTESRVPTILVLTNCENEEPMSAWTDRNRSAFNKFGYAELVPTCFAKGGKLEDHFAPLRSLSRTAVLDQIVKHALVEPYKLYGEGTERTLRDAVFHIWNQFVDWAKLPSHLRRKTNEGALQLLKRLGVSDKLAEAAVRHLPDLVEDLASKTPIPGAGKLARLVTLNLLNRFRK